jgi:hypothetical protein
MSNLMNSNSKRILAILALSAVIGFSFQNCGGVKFNAAVDSSKISGTPAVVSPSNTCSLQSLTVPIKLLFVVDNSGSNEIPTKNFGVNTCDPTKESNCTPATDPTKSFRSGSISAFFDAYQAKTNFSWGLESFFGKSGHQFINNSDMTNFGDATLMQAAIHSFNSESAGGSTPYEGALASAKAAIANDPGLHSNSVLAPLYYIVFMSDGYPTDTLKNDNSVDFNRLDQDVADVINLAPTRIHLNTLYYGTNNDPMAANTLQNMAQKGNGQFLNIDTSTTKTIAIEDLIQIPNSSCH